MHIWVPSFLDPEDIRKPSIGAIWNCAKGTGAPLVQNMEHKGPVLRPRCIGNGRARTQIPFNSIPPAQPHGVDRETSPFLTCTKSRIPTSGVRDK